MSVLWTLHWDSTHLLCSSVDVAPLRNTNKVWDLHRGLSNECVLRMDEGPDGSTVCGNFKTGVAWIWKKSKLWGCPSQLGTKCKHIGVLFSQNKALHRFPLSKFETGRERETDPKDHLASPVGSSQRLLGNAKATWQPQWDTSDRLHAGINKLNSTWGYNNIPWANSGKDSKYRKLISKQL